MAGQAAAWPCVFHINAPRIRSPKYQFSLILLNGHNCLISHSLYNLSPAPYLTKQLSYNKYRHYGAARLQESKLQDNVFRDSQELSNCYYDHLI